MKNYLTKILLVKKFMKFLLIFSAIVIAENTWKTFTVDDGLINNGVNAIEIDNFGNLWFGTGAGVSKFDGQRWTNYDTSDGLLNMNIWDVELHSNGNLWFGTTHRGIYQFDGKSWTAVSGYVGLEVYDIEIDSLGNIWVGTLDGGLSHFDGKNWIIYDTINGLNSVLDIEIDSLGTWWIGTIDSGVMNFNGQNWVTYGKSDGLGSVTIFDIEIDNFGNIWAGCFANPPFNIGGVSRFNGTNWITYNSQSQLKDNWVNNVEVDDFGIVWVGSRNGPSSFDGTSWTIYNTGDLINDNVRDIQVDEFGNIWFAAQGGVNFFGDTTTIGFYSEGNNTASDSVKPAFTDSVCILDSNITFVSKPGDVISYKDPFGDVIFRYLQQADTFGLFQAGQNYSISDTNCSVQGTFWIYTFADQKSSYCIKNNISQDFVEIQNIKKTAYNDTVTLTFDIASSKIFCPAVFDTTALYYGSIFLDSSCLLNSGIEFITLFDSISKEYYILNGDTIFYYMRTTQGGGISLNMSDGYLIGASSCNYPNTFLNKYSPNDLNLFNLKLCIEAAGAGDKIELQNVSFIFTDTTTTGTYSFNYNGPRKMVFDVAGSANFCNRINDTVAGDFAYVYPGDGDNNGKVDQFDILPIGYYWNVQGSIRDSASTDWIIQKVQWWSDSNAVYADGNGDGVVDANDIIVIADNWHKKTASKILKYLNLSDSKYSYRKLREIKNILMSNKEDEAYSLMLKIIDQLILQSLPREMSFFNYPNPFNPVTNFQYVIPRTTGQKSKVLINLYSINGKRLMSLVEEEQPPGIYNFRWSGLYNGSPVAAGIYLCEFKLGSKVIRRRIVLSK